MTTGTPAIHSTTTCGLGMPVYKISMFQGCFTAAWACLFTHLPCPSTSTQWPGLTSLHMCHVPVSPCGGMGVSVCAPVPPCSSLGMHAHTCAVSQHQHIEVRAHLCHVLLQGGTGMHALTSAVCKLCHFTAWTHIFVCKPSPSATKWWHVHACLQNVLSQPHYVAA